VPFESLGVVSYWSFKVTMAVYVAVCEIFNVKEWCDLENKVRVSSRSLEMALFDRSHTSSYSPSIVTMGYIVSSARYSDLLVKNREFFIRNLYLSSHRGWPVGVLWRCLMPIKLEWLGYRMVKNQWQYVKPFSSNPGTSQTDRQTDEQICYINIARQCADAASVCWRAIKIENSPR